MTSVLLLLDSIARSGLVSLDVSAIDSYEVHGNRTNDACSVSAPGAFGLLLDLACSLAADLGANVRVLSVIEAQANESLSMSALAAQHRRQQIVSWIRTTARALNEQWATTDRRGATGTPTEEEREAQSERGEKGEGKGEDGPSENVRGESGSPLLPDIQPLVSVSAAGSYRREVAEAIRRHDGRLLVSAWGEEGATAGGSANGSAFMQSEFPCDIVMVRPAKCDSEGKSEGRNEAIRGNGSCAGDGQEVRHLGQARILVPARGGPHAGLAVRVAASLESHRGGELALLHVLEQDLPERQRLREERPFRAMLEQANLPADTPQLWAVGRSIPGAILQHARNFDVLVLGAPTVLLGDKRTLGPVVSAVLKRASVTVMVVNTATPAEAAIRSQLRSRAFDRDLDPEALSMVVDKWFAENNFNAEEYSDLERLLEWKRQRRLTISLGLPTLNEEATIGGVITALKGALFDDVPLLDELVVIDSRSTDRTREIAQSLGVPVVVHQDILREAGPPLRGKGEALWKSLHVLKGDLIAWVYTDVSNMHPRFVYGLLGPLLQEPRLAYVKGYYHRPLVVGDKLELEGGGRVTELTVRPLFNLFFPMLSGFVQPLAGEYAGRRDVLERLPFSAATVWRPAC